MGTPYRVVNQGSPFYPQIFNIVVDTIFHHWVELVEDNKAGAGTTNPGGTRKPDNPLKGIRNPIPWDPDNYLKGIRDIVPNGIRQEG